MQTTAPSLLGNDHEGKKCKTFVGGALLKPGITLKCKRIAGMSGLKMPLEDIHTVHGIITGYAAYLPINTVTHY